MILYVAGFWLLLFALTVFAWSGRTNKPSSWSAIGEPEVGVASLLLAAAVLTVALRPAFGMRFNGVDLKMVVIDACLFVGLAAYGARSGRCWILCAAALQLLSTTAHFARATTPGMWRLGYQVMEEASSYPTLLLLAWGIWSRHRDASRSGRSRISCDARVVTRTSRGR